jgi:hypothetical protein
MKGPASKPTGLFSPMVDIGDFFVEGYLKSQSKENLTQILEVLAVEQVRGVLQHVANHALGVFMSTAMQDGVSEQTVNQARTQMIAFHSIMMALHKHGFIASESEHPLLATPASDTAATIVD